MAPPIKLPNQPIAKSAAGAGAFLIQRLLPLQTEIYLSRYAPLATLFSRVRDVMVSHTLKMIYFPIPKSACTLFATLLALHDATTRDYEPARDGIHNYRFRTGKLALKDMSYLRRDDYFKFTIIRDPYTRLVSAYFDKLIKPLKAAREGVTIRNQDKTLYGQPARRISFDSLIHYLEKAPDWAIEKHWRPQFTFFRNVSLDYIGCFEHLDLAYTVILDRYGIDVDKEVVPFVFSPKRTGYSDAAETFDPGELSRLPSGELAALPRFPDADAFYTPELRAIVERRFSRDFTLHRRALNRLSMTDVTA